MDKDQYLSSVFSVLIATIFIQQYKLWKQSVAITGLAIVMEQHLDDHYQDEVDVVFENIVEEIADDYEE